LENQQEKDKYIGNELQLFDKARNWKLYINRFISTYLRDYILEVGAGIGGTTKILCVGKQKEWLCLEPDKSLSIVIDQLIARNRLPPCCATKIGHLSDLNNEKKFDAILYIDVIEHIENDHEEISNASKHLNQKGVIVILAPAHEFLCSPFDKSLGHFRRYSKKRMYSLIPEGFKAKKRVIFLDFSGLFALLFNKFFLRKQIPSLKQVLFWDRFLVPISMILDRLLRFNFGKSLLLVIEKKD